jgi:metal-responsive CopG/Arc/MetJ family transcriptional regulator
MLECQTKDMKDQRVSVRLPGQLRRRLRESARRNGVRESEIIRKALEQQFATEAQELTAYERAHRSGIIGAVSGGASPDLSTNPKHFDGFGR